MTNEEFEPGFHSFFGRFTFQVISGDPIIPGASLYPGYSSKIFAHFASFPAIFYSDYHFVLSINSITDLITNDFESYIYRKPETLEIIIFVFLKFLFN
jgi:hypothetical protein